MASSVSGRTRSSSISTLRNWRSPASASTTAAPRSTPAACFRSAPSRQHAWGKGSVRGIRRPGFRAAGEEPICLSPGRPRPGLDLPGPAAHGRPGKSPHRQAYPACQGRQQRRRLERERPKRADQCPSAVLGAVALAHPGGGAAGLAGGHYPLAAPAFTPTAPCRHSRQP